MVPKAAELKNSAYPRNLSPDSGQYPSETTATNQPKYPYEPTAADREEIKNQEQSPLRDMKPKEDAKGGDGPSETISFNYAKPHVQY